MSDLSKINQTLDQISDILVGILKNQGGEGYQHYLQTIEAKSQMAQLRLNHERDRIEKMISQGKTPT